MTRIEPDRLETAPLDLGTAHTILWDGERLGGGFRVGIGDNPALFPDARNAELVERVQHWVEASGRRIATTRDVRARLSQTHVRRAEHVQVRQA